MRRSTRGSLASYSLELGGPDCLKAENRADRRSARYSGTGKIGGHNSKDQEDLAGLQKLKNCM